MRISFTETGFHEFAQRVLPHHRLRAWARRHAFGLDTDDTPSSLLVGVRDAHECVRLLTALSADRRPALEPELRAQADVGAYRALTVHDLACDRLDEAFDARRRLITRQHVECRFFENLRETRHVHAGLVGREIGDHRQLAVVDTRVPIDLEMHDASHARHTDTIERETNLRLFFLPIGIETQAAFALADAPVGLRLGEMRCDLRERYDVIRARLQMRLHEPAVDSQRIDVNRARGKPSRAASTPHGKLHVTRKPLEGRFVELGPKRSGDIEIGRAFRAVSRSRLIERRHGDDLRPCPQALQGSKDIPLPVAEIRPYPNVDVVHAALLSLSESEEPPLSPIAPFRVIAGTAPSLLFEQPHVVLRARASGEAEQALVRADEALADGFWIAGYLAYELGGALAGIPGHPADGPLLALGVFDAPREIALPAIERVAHAPLLSSVERAEYDAAIVSLQRGIADGEVYQVNYTVPFAFASYDDPFALYAFFANRTRAAYQAYVEDGTRAILSWSPELFLAFEGSRIVTRPMKGTAPLDDIEELANEKNRAEHVMIVDLLRNDLHRICTHVDVETLFATETYPTFATMTSTIAGHLRDDVSLLEIVRATFPCGSITGAPKRAALSFINTHEQRARGVYCGSIGYLSPQRRGWWNVAIRTAQLDRTTGLGRYDAGGGIVADSVAADEWDEVLLKSRFLRTPGDTFALLETFSSSTDEATRRLHYRRLERSAKAFGLDLADLSLSSRHAELVEAQLKLHAALRQAQGDELVRIRLSLNGEISITYAPLDRMREPLPICLASRRVRSDDPFLRHKTSWRPLHEAAMAEATARGCFDALLCNERDELTEGARTNLFFEIDGRFWTPPLACGLLPGILRERIVSEARVSERAVTLDELRCADAIYVGNSARGLLRAQLMEWR